MNRISVLGAGGWGITLANYCAQLGHEVRLWEFDPDRSGSRQCSVRLV